MIKNDNDAHIKNIKNAKTRKENMEEIKIKEKTIEYHLERKKIKNCYVAIKDGEVIVRVPTKTSQESVEQMLCKRASWILENVSEKRKKAPKQYIDGEIFSVLGKDVILKIVYDNKPKFKFKGNTFWVSLLDKQDENASQIAQAFIEQFYAELAEKEVEKAMRKMTMKVGIAPKSYKIKNLKSTWGNCSTSGNITLSKNLVMYSRRAIEYVCLHEICHLRHMNHSKQFWQMVSNYMPDYRLAEQELKK